MGSRTTRDAALIGSRGAERQGTNHFACGDYTLYRTIPPSFSAYSISDRLVFKFTVKVQMYASYCQRSRITLPSESSTWKEP